MEKIGYWGLALLALILFCGCSIATNEVEQKVVSTPYPTLTQIPDTFDTDAKLYDIASFNEAGFLLAIKFSTRVSPNTYSLTLGGRPFPCVHFEIWPTLIFCIGEIRRVQFPIQVELANIKTGISKNIGSFDLEQEFPESICAENNCTSSKYKEDCKFLEVFAFQETSTKYRICTDKQGFVRGEIDQDPLINPTPTDGST